MKGRLCKVVVVQAENKFVAFRAFPLVHLHFWVSLGRRFGRRIGSQERPQTHNEAHPSMDDKYG